MSRAGPAPVPAKMAANAPRPNRRLFLTVDAPKGGK
jgi:hypothetical protein